MNNNLAEKTVSKPVVGAGTGALIGALTGGSLGVAGKVAGTMIAVNGGWILAPIGAVIGYLGVKAFNKKNKENITRREKKKDNLYTHSNVKIWLLGHISKTVILCRTRN